jgi:hypothetical protein
MGAFSNIGAKITQYAGETFSGIGSGIGSMAKFGLKAGIGYGVGTMINNAVEAGTGKSLQPGLAGLIGAFGVSTAPGIINHIRGVDDDVDTDSPWKTICKRVTIFATMAYGVSQGVHWYNDKQAAENNLHERSGNEYLHGVVDPTATVTEATPTETTTTDTQTAAPESEAVSQPSGDTNRTADELVNDLQTTPESSDTIEYPGG